MLIDFLKQITLNNFLASTVKRFGLYAAEYGLLNFVAPAWMSTPLRYSVMTTAGSASKRLFWWVISPKPTQNFLDQPLVFVGNEEELTDLSFVVVNPSNEGYQLNYKTIQTKIRDSTKAVINGAGNYILNITMNDLMEGTGATIGSSIAGGAFVIFMGPPSLLTLPAYFLMEGPAKSFGAFCGKQAGRHLLGPQVVKPLLQAAFTSARIRNDTEHESEETEMSELISQLNELKLVTTDDIIDSFEWIEAEESPTQPIVTLYQPLPWKIIENYCGEQQPLLSISAIITAGR